MLHMNYPLRFYLVRKKRKEWKGKGKKKRGKWNSFVGLFDLKERKGKNERNMCIYEMT